MCHHLDHRAVAEWDGREEELPEPEEDGDPPVDPELVVPTPT